MAAVLENRVDGSFGFFEPGGSHSHGNISAPTRSYGNLLLALVEINHSAYGSNGDWFSGGAGWNFVGYVYYDANVTVYILGRIATNTSADNWVANYTSGSYGAYCRATLFRYSGNVSTSLEDAVIAQTEGTGSASTASAPVADEADIDSILGITVTASGSKYAAEPTQGGATWAQVRDAALWANAGTHIYKGDALNPGTLSSPVTHWLSGSGSWGSRIFLVKGYLPPRTVDRTANGMADESLSGGATHPVVVSTTVQMAAEVLAGGATHPVGVSATSQMAAEALSAAAVVQNMEAFAAANIGMANELSGGEVYAMLGAALNAAYGNEIVASTMVATTPAFVFNSLMNPEVVAGNITSLLSMAASLVMAGETVSGAATIPSNLAYTNTLGAEQVSATAGLLGQLEYTNTYVNEMVVGSAEAVQLLVLNASLDDEVASGTAVADITLQLSNPYASEQVSAAATVDLVVGASLQYANETLSTSITVTTWANAIIQMAPETVSGSYTLATPTFVGGINLGVETAYGYVITGVLPPKITRIGAGSPVVGSTTGEGVPQVIPVPVHPSTQEGDLVVLVGLHRNQDALNVTYGFSDGGGLTGGAGSVTNYARMFWSCKFFSPGMTGQLNYSHLEGSNGAQAYAAVCITYRNVHPATPLRGNAALTGNVTATAQDYAISFAGIGGVFSSAAVLTSNGLPWEEVAEPKTTSGNDIAFAVDDTNVTADMTVGPTTFSFTGGSGFQLGQIIVLQPGLLLVNYTNAMEDETAGGEGTVDIAFQLSQPMGPELVTAVALLERLVSGSVALSAETVSGTAQLIIGLTSSIQLEGETVAAGSSVALAVTAEITYGPEAVVGEAVDTSGFLGNLFYGEETLNAEMVITVALSNTTTLLPEVLSAALQVTTGLQLVEVLQNETLAADLGVAVEMVGVPTYAPERNVATLAVGLSLTKQTTALTPETLVGRLVQLWKRRFMMTAS